MTIDRFLLNRESTRETLTIYDPVVILKSSTRSWPTERVRESTRGIETIDDLVVM